MTRQQLASAAIALASVALIVLAFYCWRQFALWLFAVRQVT